MSNDFYEQELCFHMHFEPPTATAQEKRAKVISGKVIFYDPPNVVEAKETLAFYLKKHVPRLPFTEALKLEVQWRFSYKTGHTDGEFRKTRPDTDNLQKALKDVMTALRFWRDDALVADERVQKVWNKDHPGISIRITPINGTKAMGVR